MSIRLVDAALDTDLPAVRKMVLVVLANYADDEGDRVWPSCETIARRASLSQRSVELALRSLRQEGLVTMVRATRGPGSTNVHRINVSAVRTLAAASKRAARAATGRPDDAVARGERGAERGERGAERGEGRSPNPLVEATTSKGIRQTHDRAPTIQWLDTFERFWSIWPKQRRIARAASEVAWRRLNPGPELVDRIVADVQWRLEQGVWNPNGEAQFILHPTTYLNGLRWNDDHDALLAEMQGRQRGRIHAVQDDPGPLTRARVMGTTRATRNNEQTFRRAADRIRAAERAREQGYRPPAILTAAQEGDHDE